MELSFGAGCDVLREQAPGTHGLVPASADRNLGRIGGDYRHNTCQRQFVKWQLDACPDAERITVLARSTPQARGAPLRYAPAGDFRLRAVIP